VYQVGKQYLLTLTSFGITPEVSIFQNTVLRNPSAGNLVTEHVV